MSLQGGREETRCGTDVRLTIERMADAVRQGKFAVAEEVGNAAQLPLAVPKDELRIARTISDGSQATVYEVVMEGDRRAALKRVRIREPEDLVRFREEVALLCELSHPHIVGILGARMLPPDYSMILRLEATNARHGLYELGWQPGWPGALHLGAQIASAVAHLHAHSVLHRDIKPANILLSEDFKTAKLADFGIATRMKSSEDDQMGQKPASIARKPSGGFYKAHMVGTLEYMGPEVLLRRPHSPSSDIFAIAVTINELATGQFPYSDCTRDNPLAHTILEMGYSRQELVTAVVAEGLRPSIKPDTPFDIACLLKSCWDPVPERRPTASELVDALSRVGKEHYYNGAEGLMRESGKAYRRGDGGSNEPKQAIPVSYPDWAKPFVQDDQRLTGTGGELKIAMGSFATAGARGEDRMEDRCLISRNLFGLPECHLAGVFDGHRGPEAAQYLASNLEQHIYAVWETCSSPSLLLKEALQNLDAAFRQESFGTGKADVGYVASSNSYPGSTATVVLIVGRYVAVANLGDSGAVLSRDNTAVPLTQEHVSSNSAERDRIVAEGGKASVVYTEHGWRIGQAGLAVTRSVGDADVKSIGVNAEADTEEFELRPSDKFILLGTDGLWDHVEYQDAIELVNDTVKQPALVARRLVTEALARGSRDNVSAIAVLFSEDLEHGAPEKVYGQDVERKHASSDVIRKRIAARSIETEEATSVFR